MIFAAPFSRLYSTRVQPIVRALFGSQGGLGQRMARGSMWVMFSSLFMQVGSLVSLAILARFLTPGDFGLMAIVLLVLGALDTFTTPGFTQALIQREGEVEQFFPSVFTVNVLRGLCLAGITVLLGPMIASFFGKPEAALVVQFAAVIFILRSLLSPALILLDRGLQYQRVFYLNASSTIVSLVVVIILAPTLRNVWALLIATIAREFARTAGSYWIAPWLPRFKFAFGDAVELNRFGRWVVAGSIVVFLSLQLDNIVVGRVLGTTALGFYEVAFRISQLPATQISQVASTVAFPALSSVASQPDRFRAIYLRMVSYLYVINVLLGVSLILLAGPIVRYGLGPQWEAAVPILRILALAGIIRSLVSVGGRVFYATGHPKYDFLMNVGRLVVFAAIIYPMAQNWGVEGVAASVLIAISAVIPMYLWLIQKVIGISPREHVTSAFAEYSRILIQVKRGTT